ncbi:MAG: guanylate kinase [Mogibacterium sp.]|nr:guanylate kinase [Mogibacterium sp.]
MAKSFKQKGKLFVISGPSGVGKGTILSRVLQEVEGDFSISMTTRSPRPGETHGKEYYFVTEEEFLLNIERDNFLEHAVVFEHMYGTPKDEVLRRLDRGRDVYLDIDVQGGLQVKAAYPEAVMIFILPPSLKVLRERIIGRNADAADVIDKRLAGALNEIKLVGEYEYYIINDDLDVAVADALAIVRAENCEVPERVSPIIRQYENETN